MSPNHPDAFVSVVQDSGALDPQLINGPESQKEKASGEEQHDERSVLQTNI